MKRLSYGLLLVLMLLGCVREPLHKETGPYIELSVRCNDDAVDTRDGSSGTIDGLDRYNENLISDVDFFFFPGTEKEGSATYHVHRTSGAKRFDVFRIDDITSEDINTRIFPSSPSDIRKATVFAVANYPGTLVSDEDDLSAFTLDYLHSLEVRTNFVTSLDPVTFAPGVLENFLMSGEAVIDLRGRNQIMAATGSIQLERYACKMTVAVDVAEEVELDDGEVWEPMLEGMDIYLVNGSNVVNLKGTGHAPEYFSYSAARRHFAKRMSDGVTDRIEALMEKSGDYYNTYPMYMYPQAWTYGSNQGNDKEPYLKLVLPWARKEMNGYASMEKQFYYKIVIPDDHRGEEYLRHFVRNNWYHINIEVGILGSETDEASISISSGSCYMVYWQDKDVVIKQAEIGSARYLSVEKTEYWLYNVPDQTVRYVTSHAVQIKDGSIRVTRPYYGDKTSGNWLGGTVRKAGAGDIYPQDSYYLDYNLNQRKAKNGGVDWFTNTGLAIEFHHELINDYTQAEFDYSPYTISFDIVHEDRPGDERYTKHITLIQEPAVYIERVVNSDDTFVYVGHDNLGNGDRWNKKIHTSDHWGYVYVDGEQIVRPDVAYSPLNDYYMNYWRDPANDPNGVGFDYPNAEEYHWRVVWYTGGSRELYRMNVTVLPEGSDFVIGDPRQDEIDNLRSDFHERKSLDEGGTVRRLSYYYPAEASERTRNMLAPSFRFCSKCGGVEFGDLTLDQAKWRCATYQEDGFPAGRWRLPTRGEIHFVAMLSSKGAFTYLFTNGSTYWSANGGINVSNGNVSDRSPQKALTRCVYDSWYWETGDPAVDQHNPRDEFVWGDAPR